MSWLNLVLFATATIVTVTEARAIAAEPVSLMMDSNGNPVLFLREKRTPVSPYPHRAMMFTGYYRPVRRANGGQATGVFAQGNAVSGGAYLGDDQPNYLQRGPEPAEEAEVSSAEAQAAPNPLEHHVDEEEQNDSTEKQQNDQEDSSQPGQEEEQPSTYTTEAPAAEKPLVQNTQSRPSKKQGSKKSKKTPVRYEPEDNDDDESENDEDYDNDEPAMPFIPLKGNRRRQSNVPNLNNFFPMVFRFPQGYARGGSSSSSPESPPGMITAIANSYSTSKGGVASSVATAYGGSPQSKKQRRSQPAQN